MEDVQNSYETRNIGIDRVGVKDLVVPMSIQQQNGLLQQVTANINMFVNLSPDKRATHMSRFVEIIEDFRSTPISIIMANNILSAVQRKLDAKVVSISIAFTYFLEKTAPVSQKRSLLNYNCELSSVLKGEGIKHVMGVRVPVSSLCPCSKEISEYGAHNQRGVISARIHTDESMFFEELISALESNGSSEIYPLLKRVDEKFVTEKAYDNPKFVEDIIRDVGLRLDSYKNIFAYQVSCENFESIHNHNAFAEIVKGEL